jgi:hypothetical protein
MVQCVAWDGGEEGEEVGQSGRLTPPGGQKVHHEVPCRAIVREKSSEDRRMSTLLFPADLL